ncbi:uncharacterized protein LOC113227192 [Hyposmocoma kahamanoa]|uniref:uncharacterized protein LOC113227192 n=1 Tax=Hyposmocoma kahamanoa TaxID=1477025 RepID=UPI000E6DA419|nr:uncharacterized protein LOC113227192 [Hyposmocoma kahamanoa]
MGQTILLCVQLVFFVAIVTCVNYSKESDYQSIEEYHNDNSDDFIHVSPHDPYVTFAAKAALEGFKVQKAKGKSYVAFPRYINLYKVDHAELLVDDGCDYKLNFTALLNVQVYPFYKCNAMVHRNTENVFYVNKVGCKRHFVIL